MQRPHQLNLDEHLRKCAARAAARSGDPLPQLEETPLFPWTVDNVGYEINASEVVATGYKRPLDANSDLWVLVRGEPLRRVLEQALRNFRNQYDKMLKAHNKCVVVYGMLCAMKFTGSGDVTRDQLERAFNLYTHAATELTKLERGDEFVVRATILVQRTSSRSYDSAASVSAAI